MTRFACLAALLVASAAAAQSYPNRAVKVIVPWTPGQATDIAARVVAQKLQEALGQAFVIDNKPGAGGAIGTDAVAKSPPDGYTLLAASSGPLSIMPNLQKTPYEPLHDLAPISLVAATPFALVTHRSEEHTSELQSQSNLVCRLLLEKNNTKVLRAIPWPSTSFRAARSG